MHEGEWREMSIRWSRWMTVFWRPCTRWHLGLGCGCLSLLPPSPSLAPRQEQPPFLTFALFVPPVPLLLTFSPSPSPTLFTYKHYSDIFHKPQPNVNIALYSPGRILPLGQFDEVRGLDVGFVADLSTVFHWNTRQIFVFVALEYETPLNKRNEMIIWDHIIQTPDQAVIPLHRVRQEYRLLDQGTGLLQNTSFSISVHWEITPWVGKMRYDKRVFNGPRFKFPKQEEESSSPSMAM